MSDHHDISKDVRVYMAVFIGLVIGTIITVVASYFDFGSVTMNITVALIIASIKAFLVAGYFMHLISEKTAIYAIMVSTAFFFLGLMVLTLYSMKDFPDLTTITY